MTFLGRDFATLHLAWKSCATRNYLGDETPFYCNPYMPGWPTEKLPFDELLKWLLAAPVTPTPVQRVREFVESAVRGLAGGYFPDGQ